MRKIRSYLLFTSISYRIGVMILFPLLLYGITYFFVGADLGNIVKIPIFVMGEVFFDFWVFGGICSKDFKGMEYIKSSVRGKRMIKDALVTDALRKLIWLSAVVFGTYFVFGANGKIRLQEIDFLYVVTIILFGHSFILFGSAAARYVSFYPIVMVISYGAAAAASVFSILPVILPVPMFILSIACCIGANWLNVWNVMRKVERSYYDTRN